MEVSNFCDLISRLSGKLYIPITPRVDFPNFSSSTSLVGDLDMKLRLLNSQNAREVSCSAGRSDRHTVDITPGN